jgi:hypothetical protein
VLCSAWCTDKLSRYTCLTLTYCYVLTGEVFPRLRNYTPDHRATSVGTQLRGNYTRYLLAYEQAHASIDMPRSDCFNVNVNTRRMVVETVAAADPLALLAEVASKQEQQVVKDKQQEIEVQGEKEEHMKQQRLHKEVQKEQQDEQQQQQQPQEMHDQSKSTPSACSGGLNDSCTDGFNVHKRRALDNGAWIATKGTALANSVPPTTMHACSSVADTTAAPDTTAAWLQPGAVILVREAGKATDSREASSRQPSRWWAAVIAAPDQLLLEVAASRPAPVAAPSSTSVCVLLLGSSKLAWVPIAACTTFTEHAGRIALAAAWRELPEQGGTRVCGQSDTGTHNVQQRDLARLSGLRQAVRWASEPTTQRNSVTSGAPRGWVTAAGVAVLAHQLLELETQLPLDAFTCHDGATWDAWRACVRAAAAPAQLAQQVLALAARCGSAALRSGCGGAGGLAYQLAAALSDASKDTLSTQGALIKVNGMTPNPSVAGVSLALRVLNNAFDRSKLTALWKHNSCCGGSAATAATVATLQPAAGVLGVRSHASNESACGKSAGSCGKRDDIMHAQVLRQLLVAGSLASCGSTAGFAQAPLSHLEAAAATTTTAAP